MSFAGNASFTQKNTRKAHEDLPADLLHGKPILIKAT